MKHDNATPELDYIRKLYAKQDALLDEIVTELERIGMAIQIGPEEGRMLQLLIALHGAKQIVEIGTLAGYSTLWMARGLPEDGRITTINKDPEHIKLARGFFARDKDARYQITMLEGDANKMLATLTGSYDMVFIDADKISYNNYLDWAEKHIRKGGLIVADNTFLHGTIAEEEPPEHMAATTWRNMRRFNERLADRNKYNATIIPTEEGLSVAIKLF